MAIFNSHVSHYQRVACRIDAAKWHWRSWAFNAFLSSPKLVMRHFGKWSDNTWQMKKRGMGQQFSGQNGGTRKSDVDVDFFGVPKKRLESWCILLAMSRVVSWLATQDQCPTAQSFSQLQQPTSTPTAIRLLPASCSDLETRDGDGKMC